MKKWLALAVLALAGAIVGVAGAAPALTAHRDPVNVPMFADWYTPAPDGWYTIDDAGVLSGPHYGPVSASAPVMIDVAWVGQSYGHTSAVPDVDQLRLTITKGDRTIVAQTSAQGRAAWTQVFRGTTTGSACSAKRRRSTRASPPARSGSSGRTSSRPGRSRPASTT